MFRMRVACYRCSHLILFSFRVADSRGVVRQRRSFGVKHSRTDLKSAFCPQVVADCGACVGMCPRHLLSYRLHLLRPRLQISAFAVSGSEDKSVHIFNASGIVSDLLIAHMCRAYVQWPILLWILIWIKIANMSLDFFFLCPFSISVGRKAQAEQVTVRELTGHPSSVCAVAWNFDASLLASGDTQGNAVYTRGTLKLMRRLQQFIALYFEHTLSTLRYARVLPYEKSCACSIFFNKGTLLSGR